MNIIQDITDFIFVENNPHTERVMSELQKCGQYFKDAIPVFACDD